MICPHCEGEAHIVNVVSECDCNYRKRQCKVCGAYFYTVEIDGNAEEFNEALKRRENNYYHEKIKARRG